MTREISRVRAAIVWEEAGRLALIRRRRAGRVYFVFPGGGVKAGETPEAAAVREAWEELGVTVEVGMLLAEVRFTPVGAWGESRQLFYAVTAVAGQFGTGQGPEYQSFDPDNTYEPVWVPLAELAHVDVRPAMLARALSGGLQRWPRGQVIRHHEQASTE